MNESTRGDDRGCTQATLTLFCGLPGAGKTTLAKALEGQGRGVRICTDDWQQDLGVDSADDDFHERLQRLLYEHALALLATGCNVILEDGLWRAVEREEKFRDARARGARIEFHVFDVPLDDLWSRLHHRNRAGAAGAFPMTREQLDAAWELFEPPSVAELDSVDRAFLHGA